MKSIPIVHFVYISIILIAIIIVLLTFKISDKTDLVTMIGFAATLSSLILALIAIIYAFMSNASVSESVGSIKEASKEVLNSAKDISQATETLQSKINLIPNRLDTMEGMMNQLMGYAETVPAEPEAGPENVAVTNPPNDAVDAFAENTASATWISCFFFYRAFVTTREFRLADVSIALGDFDSGFNQGTLITLRAMGFLNHTWNTRTGNYQVTSFNERLGEIIQARFEELLEEKITTTLGHLPHGFHTESRRRIEERLNRINSFFA